MGRRTCSLVGLAFAVALVAVPFAHAQGDGPILPISAELPAIPPIDRPLAPVAFLEPPRVELQISPNTNMPRLEGLKDEGTNIGLAQLALESSEYIDPRYIANSAHPDDMGAWERMCVNTHDQGRRLLRDFKNFYLSENMLYVGGAIAIAAPIANTHADQGIRDWYQRGAGQSQGANDTADFFKVFGDWRYTVPIYVGLSLGSNWFPDSPVATTLGEFGNRSLRAILVGAPTVGILQPGLGSGRPYTGDSHWQPFNHNNGVSGHAFVGAVPFLTAASMTENRLLKTLFFVGSLGPAWSRIQHDDHYFSQVLLGWTFAYLSVESVNLTECQSRCIRIVPVDLPRGVGLGVQIDY